MNILFMFIIFNTVLSYDCRNILKKLFREKPKVILNIDPGSDDAFALFVLLDADKNGLIKLEAIICSNGVANVTNTCLNTIRILELLQRTDVLLYRGSINPIIKTNEKLSTCHGSDGFGDLHYNNTPNLSILQKEPGATAIYDIVIRNPHGITLIITSPLTNPALSLKIYLDLGSNFKDVYIMGGNYLGVGNIKDMAEFNFYVDPEAASIILTEIKRPITLFPWETCIDINITLDWRFNVLGQYHSKFIDFMDKVERKDYYGRSMDSRWITCDVIVALIFLNPSIILQENKYKLAVKLHGTFTRGEVIVSRNTEENIKSNLIVIEKVNSQKIKHDLIGIARKAAIKKLNNQLQR